MLNSSNYKNQALAQSYSSLQDERKRLTNRVFYDEAKVTRLLINLLEKLKIKHDHQEIQGNINPTEIIVNPKNLTVKLPEIATKTENNPQTIKSVCIIVPRFIPPEQAQGKTVLASDIYAVGLTAIYWLTQKTPDQLKSDPETGVIQWHDYVTNISPQLQQIIDRSIAGNVSDRYGNATEMLAALQPHPLHNADVYQPSDLSLNAWKIHLLCFSLVGIGILGFLGATWNFSVQKAENKPDTPKLPPLSQLDPPSPSPQSPPQVAVPPSSPVSRIREKEEPKLPPVTPNETVNEIKQPPEPPVAYIPPNPSTYLDLTLKNKPQWRQKMPAKSVALTFDDGPSMEYTLQVLGILKKHNVKATFFVVGKRVEQNCRILQQIVYDGHELGNHSYSHDYLWKNSLSWQQAEIEQTQQAIARCLKSWVPQRYGYHLPRWFRAPYGAQDGNTVKAAHNVGLHTAMWSVDTKDWHQSSTPGSIAQKATQTRGQDIVILHDGTEHGFNFRHPQASLSRQNTVDALDSLITQLKSRGIEFMTLSEAFNTQPTNIAQD